MTELEVLILLKSKEALLAELGALRGKTCERV